MIGSKGEFSGMAHLHGRVLRQKLGESDIHLESNLVMNQHPNLDMIGAL